MLKALSVPAALSWILDTALLFPFAAGAVEPVPTIVLGAEDEAAPWSYADGQGYVNDLVRLAALTGRAAVSCNSLVVSRWNRISVVGREIFQAGLRGWRYEWSGFRQQGLH